MANFDSDDPLADLLSDDNDSFFEEPEIISKRTKTPEKKTVSDIFGLSDEKNEATKTINVKKNENDWLGLDIGTFKEPEINVLQSPIKKAKPVKRISFEDDDILGSLGLNKSTESNVKTIETPAIEESSSLSNIKLEPSKKSALLKSLLGEPDDKIDVLKDKSETTLPPPSFPKISSAGTTTNPSTYSFATDVPRESRRSRHPTSSLPDPLGLFSKDLETKSTVSDIKSTNISNKIDIEPSVRSNKQVKSNIMGAGEGVSEMEVIFPVNQKELKTKSTPNIAKDLPDWLGGGSPVKTNKSEPTLKRDSITTTVDVEKISKQVNETTVVNQETTKTVNMEGLDNQLLPVQSLIAQQKLATSHIEYQNASIALQQQESQLLMALQLKKYEENLAEMQRQQQAILMKQEQQFNSLLERQFTKQHALENNMRLQQERINNHIQMLISHSPVSNTFGQSKIDEKLEELKSNKSEESSRIYEDMMNNLKQRQQEELNLQEESYRKQIAILESTAESNEDRLKKEIESLVEIYEHKIKIIKENHEKEIIDYTNKMDELVNQHKNEIKLIRENHDRVVEEIKYEYSTVLENIKQSKQSENALFENANLYASKLDTNLKILDINSKALLEIQNKVEGDYGTLSLAREETMKSKEEEIRLMRQALEKSREVAETERSQLLTLVRSLETKIAEQTQNSREERWTFQQAAATLTARTLALDREAEFNRNAIEREREQLKILRENFLAEQERLTLQLTEEKLALVTEKSRLETTTQLHQNYDSQKAKAEVEAAIKVAKEAAELTDKERENLYKQQCEIETLKRNLKDRELKLYLKEKELETFKQNAEQKIVEGEQMLMGAKALETKCNERLHNIQKQLTALTTREKKLVEEKVLLSKERLTLNTLIRQNKKCSLCAVDYTQKINDELVEMDIAPPEYSRFISEIDSDLMRLRLETENEHNISEHLEENF